MNKYWFKPKRYGYGATPSSWEGWAVTVGFIVLILFRSLSLAEEKPLRFIIELIVLVLLFIALARTKTKEDWKWRWGE